jgi:hypothetical protein
MTKKNRKVIKKAHQHRHPHIIASVPPNRVYGEWRQPEITPTSELPPDVMHEEHVVMAVPKSTWERIKHFMGWDV